MFLYFMFLVFLLFCEGMFIFLFFLKMLGNGECFVFVFLFLIDLVVFISLFFSRDSLEEDFLFLGIFRFGLFELLRRDLLEVGLILEVDILFCEELFKEWRSFLFRYFFFLLFVVVWLNFVFFE